MTARSAAILPFSFYLGACSTSLLFAEWARKYEVIDLMGASPLAKGTPVANKYLIQFSLKPFPPKGK
jgi:hypothetical protein